MGLDETLFGLMLRGWKVLTQRGASADEQARTVRTADHDLRLRLLASLLAEESLSLLVVDSPAGFRGRTLLLPAELGVAPDQTGNLTLLVMTTLVQVAMRRLGLSLPVGARRAGDTQLEGILAALLLAPRAEAWLVSELPGAVPVLSELHAILLAARPRELRGSPMEQAIELLSQRRLGAQPEDFAAVHPAALDWVTRVLIFEPQDSAQLKAQLEDALSTLLELPGRLGKGPRAVDLWGALREAERPSFVGASEQPSPEAGGEGSIASERKGRTRERVEELEALDHREPENPVVHSFEKVHTLDDYVGGKKRIDGSDEMAEHGDALDELQMDRVIRSAVQTRSMYKSDVLFDEVISDQSAGAAVEGGIPYDEWDVAKQRYRHGWCRLLPSIGVNAAPGVVSQRLVRVRDEHRAEIQRLRDELTRLASARVPRPRQADGPEVDTDALVAHLAATRAGNSADGRLYISKRRRAPDLAALVLLDTSLSTDAWVDNRRVLDVAVDATLVLGEAIDGTVSEIAVAGFHSNTRRDCRFQAFKGFGEPWAVGAARLLSAQPTGYTRIGPAIRHGASLLARSQSKDRWMLVISDGRPTDYDRYEGRYGIADVRQAIREARRDGMHVFGIGIDPRARVPMGEMFGIGSYAVLRSPSQLSRALTGLFLELGRR